MRKHFIILLSCMCLLVGCGSEKENINDAPATQTGTTTNSPDVTNKPEASKEPNETEKPATPNMEDTILANKKAINGSDAVFELPDANMEEACQANLYKYGNDILVTYNYYDPDVETDCTQINLLGIETGKILYQTKLVDGMGLRFQIINDNIYAIDYEKGKTVVMNNNLENIKEYTFEGNYYFDAKEENVVLFTSDRGVVVKNLETEKEEVILENAKNPIIFDSVGDRVTFTYIDSNTRKKCAAYVDLVTLNVVKGDIPYSMWNLYCSDSTWLVQINNRQPSYLIANGNSQMMFNAKLMDAIYMNHESSDIFKVYGDYDKYSTNIEIFDKNGKFVSECDIDNAVYIDIGAPIWYEDYEGYIFAVSNEEGHDRLMFWDVSQKVDGEDLELYAVEEFLEVKEGTAVSADYYKRAKELGEKYGVQIRIADQCDTDYDMYTTIQHTDENDLKTSLDYLEKCLAAYPEGFFEQFKAGEYSSVEINLMGDMTIKIGDVDPVGFIECQSGKYVMGIDIRPVDFVGQTTEQIFYHEVSHMIEEKLLRETEFFNNGFTDEKWASFNPEGFVYTDDSEEGISMFGEYYYAFIDEYGTTNVREDRARILEYASYGLWKEMEDYEIIIDKYNYYCDSIRKGFDTTGWPEKTFWEDTDWRK